MQNKVELTKLLIKIIIKIRHLKVTKSKNRFAFERIEK